MAQALSVCWCAGEAAAADWALGVLAYNAMGLDGRPPQTDNPAALISLYLAATSTQGPANSTQAAAETSSRKLAVIALGLMGVDEGAVVSVRLVALCLEDRDPAVRGAAARALIALKHCSPAVLTLAAALTHTQLRVRRGRT